MQDTGLRLLGPPQVEVGDEIAAIRLRKAGALLAYLAVEHRAFSREYLAAILWPELPHRKALSNLRQTLTSIRAILRDGCIVSDGDQVHLEHVRVDIDEFSRLTSNGDGDRVRLERATTLYRGDFLEGFNLGDCPEFDEWQDSVRERFRTLFDATLKTLCRLLMESGDYAAALPHALCWLEQDHWNEAAHRTLMEIYSRLGRTGAAIRQYEDCRHHLAEADFEPDDETRELYQHLVKIHANSGSRDFASGDPTGSDATGPRTTNPKILGVPQRQRRAAGFGGGGSSGPGNHRSPELGDPNASEPGDSDEAGSGNRGASEPVGQDWSGSGRRRSSGVRRRLLVAIALVAILGPIGGWWSSQNLSAADIAVVAVDVVQESEALSGLGVGFRITRPGSRNITFDVVFSTDSSLGLNRDYVVYHGRRNLRVGRDLSTYLDVETGINAYVRDHDIPIPPGWYTASVFASPAGADRELRPADNNLADKTVFFYDSYEPTAVVELRVDHGGTRVIDVENPLLVFLGTDSLAPGDWASLTTVRPGRLYLPLTDLPRYPTENSDELFMLFIHDMGNDLANPYEPGPGDLAGILADAPGGIAYGTFTVHSGSPVNPGSGYVVRFGDATPPRPDEYEPDDTLPNGTRLELGSYPVEHYRTFHDNGTDLDDWDWYTVFVEDGQSIMVETRSAGTGWESDTAIDLSSQNWDYLMSGHRPEQGSQYDVLNFINNTGTDQLFHLCIHPRNKNDTFVNHKSGEYIVAFRRGIATGP